MKIVITGANGYLGSIFYKYLKNTYEVIGIFSDNYHNKNEYCIDLEDSSSIVSLSNILNDSYAIIHCAANKSIDAISINNKINKNCIKAFKNSNCKKFIFLSGLSVFENFGEKTIDEGTQLPSSHQNPYICSKIYGEKYTKNNLNKNDYAILRINSPYGYNMPLNYVIQIFLSRAIENLPLYIYGQGERIQQFTYIEDIVKVINIIINKDLKGTLHFFGDEILSMSKLAELIIDITNSNSEIIFKPSINENYLNLPKYKDGIISKYMKNSEKTTLKNGLLKMYSLKAQV